ncbi:predicted protein, partial [Nematostella vectensis]
SSYDRWVLTWLFFDFFTHLLLEGSFVYISLTGTVKESDSPLAILWKEYGHADNRYLNSDPTVVAIELLTVVLCLVIVALIHAICNNTYYRHFLQIILCIAELYGGWMTFFPEWLGGSPSLDTSDPVHHYLYLWFFNGIWVLVPFLLLFHSLMAMKDSHLGHSKRD